MLHSMALLLGDQPTKTGIWIQKMSHLYPKQSKLDIGMAYKSISDRLNTFSNTRFRPLDIYSQTD